MWSPGVQERSSSRLVICQRMLIVDSSVTLGMHHRKVVSCFYTVSRDPYTEVNGRSCSILCIQISFTDAFKLVMITNQWLSSALAVWLLKLWWYNIRKYTRSVLKVVCNLSNFWYLIYHTLSGTTFTKPFEPRTAVIVCVIESARKHSLEIHVSIDMVASRKLHICDVNLPFLHIPEVLFWDLETAEAIGVHWTSWACVHVFMHWVFFVFPCCSRHNSFKCHLLWWNRLSSI